MILRQIIARRDRLRKAGPWGLRSIRSHEARLARRSTRKVIRKALGKGTEPGSIMTITVTRPHAQGFMDVGWAPESEQIKDDIPTTTLTLTLPDIPW